MSFLKRIPVLVVVVAFCITCGPARDRTLQRDIIECPEDPMSIFPERVDLPSMDGGQWYNIDLTNRSAATSTIKVAAWNIEQLTNNKAKDAVVVNQIADVAAKYDLIGIEEVKDVGPIRKIKKAIKTRKNQNYRTITTKKKGTTANTRERYSFIYNANTIKALNKGRYGSVRGMVRPPYYAYFGARIAGGVGFDFILMLTHTQGPTGSGLAKELKLLGKNYGTAKARNNGEGDIILAGDFNANPDYVHFRTHITDKFNMKFIIPKGTSTMITGMGTNTNDNMVWEQPTNEDYAGNAGVDSFDKPMNNPAKAKKVSDHRPVWAEFHTDKDSD